jgi:hypothetical protein
MNNEENNPLIHEPKMDVDIENSDLIKLLIKQNDDTNKEFLYQIFKKYDKLNCNKLTKEELYLLFEEVYMETNKENTEEKKIFLKSNIGKKIIENSVNNILSSNNYITFDEFFNIVYTHHYNLFEKGKFWMFLLFIKQKVCPFYRIKSRI